MPELFWFVLPGSVAAALAWTLTPLVARLAVRVGAVDMPGERKIHTTPIPRLGGLSVVASIGLVLGGASWLALPRWELPFQLAIGVGLGVLPVLLISVADDIRSVGAATKLLVHLFGAIIAVSFGISLSPVIHLFGVPIALGALAAPISVLWLVGVTNAFNVIDGLDGLSAGLALISAASLSAVFVLVGQPTMGGVALVLAGALAGFLPYNVHPARLFLGDTGATAIGFCLGAFALKGGSTLSSGFAVLMPVFILGLPLADTLIAILRRGLHRLEHGAGGPFVADRNHIHHRLLALGVEHGKAVTILYAAGLILAAATFLSVFLTAREAALFMIALLLAGLVGIQRLGYDEFAFIRRGAVLRMYEVPAVQRGMFVVFVDLALAFVASYISLGLKADLWSLSAQRRPVLELATTLAPVTVMVFWWLKLYRGSWRVAGLQDLTRVVLAVAVATSIGALLISLWARGSYPLSLFGIYAVINLMLTAALRASYVILETTQLRANNKGTPIVIYGAGRRGVAAMRELLSASSGLRPIGFIDDDVRKRDRLVSGLPVFGGGHELSDIMTRQGASALLIATARIPSGRVDHAVTVCSKNGADIFKLAIKLERLGHGGDSHVFEAGQPAPRWSEVAMDSTAELPQVSPTDVLGSAPCPSCGSREMQRSKARSFYERLRKEYTPRRLFRCVKCDWRGWLLPLEPVSLVSPDPAPPPDLGLLDVTQDENKAASSRGVA